MAPDGKPGMDRLVADKDDVAANRVDDAVSPNPAKLTNEPVSADVSR
jgi:hypothetical protein